MGFNSAFKGLMFCTNMKYIGIREVLSYCSVWCRDDTFDVST